jgi:hypothetical protein
VSLPGCCDASTAADGPALPAAAPPSATLQSSSARVLAGSASTSRRKVEGLRPAAVAGWSCPHRGSPSLPPRLWCACGGSLTAAPCPDQPSLARGLGRGGCPAISPSLPLFRSRARPPVVEGTRTRMHTFSVLHPCTSLHVATRVNGKRARLESRPHPLADLRRPDSRAMGMGLLGPARLGTPGAAGLDAGCQAGGGGSDGSCAWGTDGLCAWVTNELGTDVLASAAAPSGGGAGMGRD